MSKGDPHLRRAAHSLPRDPGDPTLSELTRVRIGREAWPGRGERLRAVAGLVGMVVLLGLGAALAVALVVAFLGVIVSAAVG